MTDAPELLTNSRMTCSKTCLRKHYYRFELRLMKERESKPLRMGTAVHWGLEHWKYPEKPAYPEWCETEELRHDWDVEFETVNRLLEGYFQYWKDDEIEIIEQELQFKVPIVNPETGRPTPNFCAAGKLDGIVRLDDGRLAVMEHKTTSESIDPESDYWKKLRIDQQISHYYIAALELGFDVETVLYNVIKKPRTRPCLIPVLDEEGRKQVFDQDGNRVWKDEEKKKPRLSADKKKGFELLQRKETAEEYGVRLAEHIAANPSEYYARHEIPRLDTDLEEYRAELWEQQKLMRVCQKSGFWFRNTNACIRPYRCPFLDICHYGMNVTKDDVPDGFIIGDKHPELDLEEFEG